VEHDAVSVDVPEDVAKVETLLQAADLGTQKDPSLRSGWRSGCLRPRQLRWPRVADDCHRIKQPSANLARLL